MCLAIPGQVEQVYDQQGLRMGRINFGGIRKNICLAYTPEAITGDFVLVHVGFAISKIDEAEALRTLQGLDDEQKHADLYPDRGESQ